MKRNFTTFILLLAATLLLVSCANVDPYAGESTASGDESIGSVFDLPDHDGFADEVTVAMTKNSFFEDLDTTVGSIDAAEATRKKEFRRKYGAELCYVYISEEDVQAKVRMADMTGLPLGDIYCFSQKNTLALAKNGMIKDLNSLEGFDPDASFVRSGDKNLSDNGKLWFVTSPSTLDAASTWCIFYNRGLLGGKKDPATLYLNGGWTWDKLLEYASGASNDNTDGLNVATDVSTVSAMWASTGYSFENAVEKGNAAALINKIYSSDSTHMYNNSDSLAAFTSGKLAFLMCRLENAVEIAESGVDWCVVPMPSAGGSSLCLIESDATCFSLLSNTPDEKASTVLLNAMLITGGERFTEAVSDTMIALCCRDNAQTVMINKVLDTASAAKDHVFFAEELQKLFSAGENEQ